MKNNERKVSIAITLIVIVMLVLVTVSYAYFSNSEKSENKTVQVDELKITYSDENMDSVNLSNIAPIHDEDIKTKASKLEFKVTNTSSNKAYVDIYLNDIVLPDELVSLEFKWALYSGNEKIYNGNFRNILGSKQLLMNNIELNKKESKSYQLYIWISENDLNQNNMMNKTFSAKILVNGNQKKSNDLLTKVIKDNNPLQADTPNFNKAAVSQEYYDSLENKTDYIVQNGVYKDIDDDGETYYFRGAVANNYVKLGTKLWQIIRINGDNTIRLIDSDTEGESTFNTTNWGDERYVGYTYNNSEPNKQDGTPSAIKTYIDNWYSENLASTTDKNKNFDRLIANTRFCNDTLTYSTRYSKSYGAQSRLVYTSKKPVYTCSNTNQIYGGGYDLKIGLITADEISFAGGLYNRLNTNYYLNRNKNYWTGSPCIFGGTYAYEFVVKEDSTFTLEKVHFQNYSVIPVISLRSDTLFISGDGTIDNPYSLPVN